MTNRKVKCPVCGSKSNSFNRLTRHHIYYPKKEYEKNVSVIICEDCHREFNAMYRFYQQPTQWECLMNLLQFCKSKGKNALTVYPQILKLS